MTCHHRPGDPDCSSSPEGAVRIAQERADDAIRRVEERVRELMARSPNPDDYEVLEVEPVGDYLVVRLRYSACEKCSFDSEKIVVLQATLRDAVFWTRADPHFSDKARTRSEMPSPLARFPATEEGWSDALDYVLRKSGLSR